MKDLKKNKFFELKSLVPEKGAGDDSTKIESAYLNSHTERVENLNKIMRLPEQGEIFFLQTEKAFNAFTFIPWLAEKYFIEELFASTYSISRRVVEALCDLQNSGKVGEVTLLISDSMIKRNAKTIEVLEGVIKHNANFKVKYFWNHSKVCLLKTKEHNIVLEGSGNWSENALLEQYVLVNSEEIYNFRKQMFE